MQYLTKIFITIVLLFTVTLVTFAEEDQFTVKQLIGADTVAPSIPANLTATAISASQINLSWNASTDDVAVTGYRVFRDSVFIATTTAITYSDTGLTASTSYSYNVSAFDAAINISGLSNTATATTLSEAIIPPNNITTGGSIPLLLQNLFVETGLTNALLRFQTNIYTQAVVSFGLTPDYELGSITSDIFVTNHETSITGLTAGTLYYFKIEITDIYGRKLILSNQQFWTKFLPSKIVPSNVTNLKAVGDDKVITLSWNNPKIDFDQVRIVKSDKFYPKDLFDGEVIYEGGAEKFVDKDVVYGKMYYYTLFAKDTFGNYSSGAMAKDKLRKTGEIKDEKSLFEDIVELSANLVNPIIRALTIADLDFFQDGKKLEVKDNTVNIAGDRELQISLNYKKIPEILKTIAITMTDPQDEEKSFSFLLRVNKDKTAYEATIAPLGRNGNFKFGVAILDHKNQGLKKLAGVIVSIVPLLQSQNPSIVWKNIFGILFIILILLILFFRKRECCCVEKLKNDY